MDCFDKKQYDDLLKYIKKLYIFIFLINTLFETIVHQQNLEISILQ